MLSVPVPLPLPLPLLSVHRRWNRHGRHPETSITCQHRREESKSNYSVVGREGGQAARNMGEGSRWPERTKYRKPSPEVRGDWVGPQTKLFLWSNRSSTLRQKPSSPGESRVCALSEVESVRFSHCRHACLGLATVCSRSRRSGRPAPCGAPKGQSLPRNRSSECYPS